MLSQIFLTKQLFYGAAAAAVIGLGAGAWLRTPADPVRDPDPYAHVAINLPQTDPYANYGLTSSGWLASQAPALPASQAAWNGDAGFDATGALRELLPPERPAKVQPATYRTEAAQPEPDAAPTQVAARRDFTDERRWPSRRGDVLAWSETRTDEGPDVDQGPPEAGPDGFDRYGAAPEDDRPDPGAWDAPDPGPDDPS